MNKPVYLGLSILELSKILVSVFWYDYLKLKYCEIVYIKIVDIYRDIAEGVETRFDTSNYELECNFIDRLLPKGKKKKKSNLINER